MTNIFVSYHREDLAPVGRLVAALRAEGIDVWWDQDIPPNAAWEATIERELAAATLVIVAWSPAAVASDNVKSEARWARAKGRLLQVFVKPCDPPLFFGERQGVDLKQWTGAASEVGFRSVLEVVRKGPKSSPAPVQDAAVAPDCPPPLPGKPSIAVLPFANRSGDPEQDYFADGMVEEIVAALSRFKSLFVIGSGSSLSFKGKGTTPQDAARMLGVRYILEGSVRKSGGRVRIGVELIDAADGAQIWADRFEDTLEDVFALQDRVALAVAGVIGPAVHDAEFRRASARPTENMGSYDLFLRAQTSYRIVSKSDMRAALDLFGRAIALDPNYGWAMAMAANCHAFIILFGWSDDGEVHLNAARRLIERGTATARDDPEVLAYLANAMMMIGGDLEAAATLAERATTLNPGSALVWGASGWVRLSRGETALAAGHWETSLRLNPLSPDRHFNFGGLGVAHFVQGRFREAISWFRQSAQLRPEWPLPLAFLAASHGHLGENDAAREALARYRSSTSVDIHDWLAIWSLPEVQKRLLLDGITLAESPLDATAPS